MTSINEKQINDIQIKPVDKPKDKNAKNVLGYDWFPLSTANVGLIARKGSGKSTVVYHAIMKCIDKDCQVIIFSPTQKFDPTYVKLEKELTKRGNTVVQLNHFIDDNGVNLLEQLLVLLERNAELERQRKLDDDDEGKVVLFDSPQEEEKLKTGKIKIRKKKESAKFCMVFDDLSNLMSHKSVSRWLTKSRHYLARNFIVLHDVVNLSPMGICMLDNILVFPKVSEHRVQEIAEKCGLQFKQDKRGHSFLIDLHKKATDEPYSFLYIDINKQQYRKKFDKQLVFQE